ncbi:hypothetical protein PBV87_11575 [Niameybacter massiliensis]|uniref:Uncharacterized protein n=1 Tax=Holtiella tumoricola TaxID=3018743 RepID=A0AA42J1D5_9FIRM|nr:hypothetical protein [Holtiella tumoricola]MDA3732123.1 hypothetical protein [Holtiella tumoricola]
MDIFMIILQLIGIALSAYGGVITINLVMLRVIIMLCSIRLLIERRTNRGEK